MNENNSPSSKTELVNGGKHENVSTTFQKGYGYVGLITIAFLAYWLLSPKIMYSEANPRPYILNEKYYHKTMLSEIIILLNSGHAYEVKYAGKRFLECEDAKKSISNNGTYPSEETVIANINQLSERGEKLKALKLLLSACANPYIESSDNIERAVKLEPDYVNLLNRYQELRKKIETLHGTTIDKENYQGSVREMTSIYEKMDKIRRPLIERSMNQLILINGISHVMILVFLGLGIYFRRGFEKVLLTPFGWVFLIIRKFHQKI